MQQQTFLFYLNASAYAGRNQTVNFKLIELNTFGNYDTFNSIKPAN